MKKFFYTPEDVNDLIYNKDGANKKNNISYSDLTKLVDKLSEEELSKLKMTYSAYGLKKIIKKYVNDADDELLNNAPMRYYNKLFEYIAVKLQELKMQRIEKNQNDILKKIKK